jgi:hypothetical protein
MSRTQNCSKVNLQENYIFKNKMIGIKKMIMIPPILNLLKDPPN